MKKNKTYVVFLCILLLCAMTIQLTGCATTIKAANLMDGITPNGVKALDHLDGYSADATDFSLRLIKAANRENKNTLLSPLSVLCALAMTANGADGETLEQMEAALGMKTEELNLFLYSYLNSLSQSEKSKLNLANSIWFTEDKHFSVKQDFLQTNADYYGADLYMAPFNDQTLKDINLWVSRKTDEMIPSVLDQLSPDAVMYLINALAFDAEWMQSYEKDQIRGGIFTKEDGSTQGAEMMYSTEGIYLEDENATGFLKYYSEGKYAFAALLPKEGISVSDYIQALDGASLHTLLSEGQNREVDTAIPKFEIEYETELSDVLKTMGMTDAFDGYRADFKKLGTYTNSNIFINQVIHKTYIDVGENGTKAGASTVVEISKTSLERPTQHPTVYLDRPFVYMILDCENHIPFFIGTMTDLNG